MRLAIRVALFGRALATRLSAFHDHLLKRFNRREKYVYVMILADDFRKRFQEANPNGRFFHFSISYSFCANCGERRSKTPLRR